MDQTPEGLVDTRRFPSSWRLTFRYDETGGVELAHQEELPMIAPGSAEPIPGDREYSGSWVELQDQHGQVLFRQVLHDPFRSTVEVHHPDRREQVVPDRRPPGEFEVLVPAMPAATTVALWSSPPEADRRNEAAREVGRFQLGRPNGTDR